MLALSSNTGLFTVQGKSNQSHQDPQTPSRALSFLETLTEAWKVRRNHIIQVVQRPVSKGLSSYKENPAQATLNRVHSPRQESSSLSRAAGSALELNSRGVRGPRGTIVQTHDEPQLLPNRQAMILMSEPCGYLTVLPRLFWS